MTNTLEQIRAPHRTPNQLSPSFAIAIAALCLLFIVVLSRSARPQETNFLSFYSGASLALEGKWQDMYNREALLARERAFVPGVAHVAHYVRPPAYALVTAPLALLSFNAAFWVWMVTQWALFFGATAWAWRRFGPEAAVWSHLFFAVPVGICLGQDCAAYLVLCIAAFVLVERGRALSGGAVLGLLFVKVHLILLWPLVLIVQRRWRILIGMSAIAGIGAAASVLLLGPAGLRQYFAVLAEVKAFHSPATNVDLWGILSNFRIAIWPVLAVCTGIIVYLVIRAASRPVPLWEIFAIGTSGSLLVSPRAYMYDAAMLLLPLWFVIFLSQRRWSRIAAVTICTPVTVLSSLVPQPYTVFSAVCLLAFVLLLCLEKQSGLNDRPMTEFPIVRRQRTGSI
jgi:hypothetical protein